jgi:hypothetical protein
MKKLFSFLFLPLLILSACEKDPYTDPHGNGNNGSYTDDPVDPVVPNTTIEDNFVLEDEDDAIANTTFDRTISIVFAATGATVSGDENGIVTVAGNDVTVNNTTKEAIRYELSGTAADGFFKIYGEKKQAIVLNGLDLTNPNGAAINNQNKKRTFVVVNGTNQLADGKKYTDTPEDEDEKGAFFSEAQLIFSGSGSLSVTSTGGKAGISSDDYVCVLDAPTITISATKGHGVRGKDAVVIGGGKLDVTVSKEGKKAITSDGTVRLDGGEVKLTVSGGVDDSDLTDLSSSSGIKADVAFVMNGGTLAITNSGQGGKGISGDAGGLIAGGTIDIYVTGSNYEITGADTVGLEDTSSSAKGIKFDGKLVITGGSVTVSAKNHEAIEAKGELIITGGDVYATSSDDAINSGSHMILGGGRVCAISTGNDGLDANGNCYIQGALVYAVGSGTPEVAVDANTEDGYKLYVISGTLVAIGGLEGGANLTQACYSANWSANTWYGLYQDGALALAFQTPSRGGNTLVVSTGGATTLKSGVTASGTKIFGGMGATAASGGSSVTLSSYTAAGGMGGPGGPGVGPGFWR